MKFYSPLFISEKIKDKEVLLKKKITQQEVLFHIYVIVVPENSENQLEIFHVGMNEQLLFSLDKSLIIGIANGYQESILLAEKITKLVYNETGTANIKDYFITNYKKSKLGGI